MPALSGHIQGKVGYGTIYTTVTDYAGRMAPSSFTPERSACLKKNKVKDRSYGGNLFLQDAQSGVLIRGDCHSATVF